MEKSKGEKPKSAENTPTKMTEIQNLKQTKSALMVTHRLKRVIESSSFSNVISLLALLVACYSIYFSYRQSKDTERFSMKMSEGMIINEDVFIINENSSYFLEIDVPIFITNTSGINQPLNRVDLTIGEVTLMGVENIFKLNGDPIELPINISGKESTGIKIKSKIPIEPEFANLISSKFSFGANFSKEKIGKYKDLRYTLRNLKLSNEQHLYESNRKKVNIEFWFLSASDEPFSSVIYPLLIP